MKATTILKQEHQAILVVISAAEKEVAYIKNTGKLRIDTVAKMVDFLRNFVDRCHHTKEEKHLFPMINVRGIAKDSGPVAVMLREHEEGRNYVRALAEAVTSNGAPDSKATLRTAENLAAYTGLIRAHIDKEDNVLYPMADRILTTADHKQLTEAFEEVESQEMGEDVHEKYHAWIEELSGM